MGNMKVRKILAICFLLVTVSYAIFCFVKYKTGDISVLSGIVVPILGLASSIINMFVAWDKKTENNF